MTNRLHLQVRAMALSGASAGRLADAVVAPGSRRTLSDKAVRSMADDLHTDARRIVPRVASSDRVGRRPMRFSLPTLTERERQAAAMTPEALALIEEGERESSWLADAHAGLVAALNLRRAARLLRASRRRTSRSAPRKAARAPRTSRSRPTATTSAGADPPGPVDPPRPAPRSAPEGEADLELDDSLFVRADRLDDAATSEPWIFANIALAGCLTTIDGPGGVGKSTLLAALIAAGTRGTSLPWAEYRLNRPLRVLVVDGGDMSPTQVRDSLRRAGADMARCRIRRLGAAPKDADLARWLRACATRYPDEPVLVVIDSVYPFCRLSSAAPRDALQLTLLAAAETGAAIVAVRHWIKNARLRSADQRGAGSFRWHSDSRIVLSFGWDPDPTHSGRRILASVKNNCAGHVPSQAFVISGPRLGEVGPDDDGVDGNGLQWVDSSSVDADELIARSPTHDRAETVVDRAVRFLAAELAGGRSVRRVDLEAIAGSLPEPTLPYALYRAAAQLGVVRENRGASGRMIEAVWSLPMGTPAPGVSDGVLRAEIAANVEDAHGAPSDTTSTLSDGDVRRQGPTSTGTTAASGPSDSPQTPTRIHYELDPTIPPERSRVAPLTAEPPPRIRQLELDPADPVVAPEIGVTSGPVSPSPQGPKLEAAKKLVWFRSNNKKVGPVIACIVGETMEEVSESCAGCRLLPPLDANGRPSGPIACYAHGGHYGYNVPIILRGYHAHPERYTFEEALRRVRREIGTRIRVVRISVIGDAARADRTQLWADIALARANGLVVIAYTHMWREPWAQDLKGVFLASCNNTREAEQAIALGWIPTVIVPSDHKGRRVPLSDGRELRVCPAQLSPRATTCNSCRMCSPGSPGLSLKRRDDPEAPRVAGIAFPSHGWGRSGVAAVDRIARQGLAPSLEAGELDDDEFELVEDEEVERDA